jgi:hypothetical protein
MKVAPTYTRSSDATWAILGDHLPIRRRILGRVRPNRRAQALHGVNRSFGNVLTSTVHGASLRT